MLPSKLRHILGCSAFSEKKLFVKKKRPYVGQITFWKYNGTPFFYFSQNRPSGPSWSSSRKVCLCVVLIVCCPLPMWFFLRPLIVFFLWSKKANKIYHKIYQQKKNHATSSNLYWSYYSHRSRELVSPVCRIFLILTKTLPKKFRIEIWAFSFQICFRNHFSTLGSGQTENTQIRVFVYFLFDHFPKSKIDFESRFEKNALISILIFFWRVSVSILKKSNNWFPIVFSKSDWTGVGSFFDTFFLKSQTPQNMPKFGW